VRGHPIPVSRLVLILAVLALIGLPTGCGASGNQLSEDEYQQELDTASSDVRQASEQLGTELSNAIAGGGSFEQAADEMKAVREQLDATASELDSVSPPEESAAAHDRLVDAMRSYSDDLAEIQGTLESGNVSEITQKLGSIESLDSKDLQRAGAALRELGYTFET
jgi:predicted flap endonuclease-1-like 5' DNA nuclease